MIAERNRDRTELNQRAQALLKAHGSLGAGFEIGDSTFHIGDRVVAQAQDRQLRPARWIETGSCVERVDRDRSPDSPVPNTHLMSLSTSMVSGPSRSRTTGSLNPSVPVVVAASPPLTRSRRSRRRGKPTMLPSVSPLPVRSTGPDSMSLSPEAAMILKIYSIDPELHTRHEPNNELPAAAINGP